VHTHGGVMTFDQPGIKTLTLQPLQINQDCFAGSRPGFTFKEIILIPMD
jgi:hypothetical protein